MASAGDGGGEANANGGTGESSGGDPAIPFSGKDSSTEPMGEGIAAQASNVPIKDPLGPGPFSLDDFDMGVTLGTGSFGRVRIAMHRGTQTPWAIKMLKKAEILRMQQV